MARAERIVTSIVDGEKVLEPGSATGAPGPPGGGWRGLRARRFRGTRFVMVGAVCFGVQLLVLEALSHGGVAATVGDGVGFTVSAEINFTLSSLFTWGDRPWSGRRALLRRLIGYNATAAVSLLVNVVVFGLLHARFGHLLAAVAGVLCGMVFTYTLCALFVFRAAVSDDDPGKEPPEQIDLRRPRPLETVGVVERNTAEGPTPAPVAPEAGAPRVMSGAQKVALVGLAAAVAAGLVLRPLLTVLVVNAALTLFFVSANIMKLVLIRRGMDHSDRSTEPPSRLPDETLPVYTILLPVYREASVLSQLVTGIGRLDYPSDRLDVKLLLEVDDIETRQAAEQIDLPPCFEVVLIPDVGPTGKPRACNVGLARAKGEYLVIYDAEDRPEPDQLRKAVAAFQDAGNGAVCYQAKLNYFNRTHNLLTRWFTAEYSLWFDKLLPGLQAMDVAVPLGGTSNHFMIDRLRELDGWNAYNVTEDADLGMRIYLHGWKTAILDSTTFEEATSRPYNWVRQRSRWVKGYMQTYLFFMRHPARLARRMGPKAFVAFHLFFGAGTLCLLLNPIYWLLTVVWYGTHLAGIQSVFPLPVLYVGTIGLFLGNVAFTLANVSGCFGRRNYEDVKWALLSPIYWVLMSVAAWKALIQLCYKPHYWEKTVHGYCAFEDVDDEAEIAERSVA